VLKTSLLWPEVQKVVAEIGFDEDTVRALGATWLNFGRAWCVAEGALCRSGKKATIGAMGPAIPQALILWAGKKKRKDDTVAFSFDRDEVAADMLKWWKALSEVRLDNADVIVAQEWCAPGVEGILLLVLGMKWWGMAQAGAAWETVVKEMTVVFRLIPEGQAL